MRSKLYEIYKKYKISILIAFIIILIGSIGLILFNLKLNSELKFVDTSNYSLKYDKSWKVKEEKENYIILNHKSSKSKLKIEIIELDKEYKYSTIDDLIDEIIYNISNQNKTYKLISNHNDTFTKMEFNGYKLLYEVDNEQVMINTYKKSDKLIFISYEATNEYFDILLDSVQNIIYNFNTVDEQFNVKNNLKLDTTEMKYSSSEELDNILDEKKEYEIGDKNYKVVYSLPSSFELSSFNTTSNYFNLRNIEDASMSLSVYIYNKNIFEYLDKDNITNVYKNYNSYKTDDEYTDYEEQISKLDTEYNDTYIYKNSYTKDATRYTGNFEKETYKKKYENAEIIYSLNKNHILVISIKANDISITEKLIKSIVVKNIENYSSYTKSTIKDNYLNAELKRYEGYDKNNILKINIKLPDTYKEIDKANNLYEERYFGLNYDEEKELYDYIVHYRLTSTYSNDINGQLDILHTMFSKAYGDYNYYEKIGDNQYNDKLFEVYQGGYTNLGGIPFTNINRYRYYINHQALFYKLENGGYLIIEIKGNGKEISDAIIKEATNFEIK